MLRLSVSLGLVLGIGALTGGVWMLPAAVEASPDQPEDPVTDWNNRWDKTLKDAAKEYTNLYKKYETKLEATASYTRWRVLRYLPDDPETRANLGYVKHQDGSPGWERNDVIHDKLKELADLDDPKTTKYAKDLQASDAKVQNWFKGLALKATENGAAKNASADAKWTEKAQKAWERVLEVDDSPSNKTAEDAHKALGHPQYEKRYVSPYKLQFLKNRADRKTIGTKEAAIVVKPVDAVEVDGKFKDSGLAGGGAKSKNFLVNAVQGKDVAMKLAADCEKGLVDMEAVYGFPETVKDRMEVKKLSLVKEQEEYRKFLTKGAQWNDAKVQKYLDAHFGNVGLGNEFLLTSTGSADSEDSCMNITAMSATRAAQFLARAEVGVTVKEVKDGVEDWLWQSIGYDVTKRVLGTALSVWGTFGKYGDAIEGRPGEDKWVELARRLVETDDDVPLARLPKLKLDNQDFKGPQTIKGWAFLQFVFEKDPEAAKKFIWQALANGTEAAVIAIYPDDPANPNAEKSMEKLDAEYRRWITKAW